MQNSDAESEILRHLLLEYLKTKARDVEEIEALPLRSLVHRAMGIAG